MIRFVHITDTHIGPTLDTEVFRTNPAELYERLVRYISSLPFTPDFIVHTGDVASDPHEDAYALAGSIARPLSSPMFYVAGNHDSADLMWKYFSPLCAGLERSPSGSFTYRFGLGEQNFIVVDASGSEGGASHGLVQGTDLAFVEEQLQRHASSSIFIHFPLLPHDCPWSDESMLPDNGRALHELLVSHAKTVRGVFHGHLHRGVQLASQGILYSGAPSVCCQFTSWPTPHDPGEDTSISLRFNIVTMMRDKVIIKEFCAPS
jgi:Icc protein